MVRTWDIFLPTAVHLFAEVPNEMLRTGADPVNDPWWILTATPVGSTVDHDRLRIAGAGAAQAMF